MWRYNNIYTGYVATRSTDQIEHFGIPRRSGRYKYGSGKEPYQSTDGKPTKMSKKEQAIAANKASQEKMKTMTNDELLAEVNRLRLEESYRQLTQVKIPESTIKKFASEIVQKSVKEVSSKLLTAALTEAANKTLKTKMPIVSAPKK